MQYKIAQLMLTSGRKANTASDIFVAQPDAIKESLAGKLFVLVEIDTKNIDSLKVIHFLINRLNAHYYQNEKIILREKIAALKIEHIFEAALAKTNKDFWRFIKNEKIKFDAGMINATAGVIHEETLYFANTGKNKIFLIYRFPNKPANREAVKNTEERPREEYRRDREYKMADLGIQASAAGEKDETDFGETEYKLFTNVVSGRIPPSACFIISNEAMPEYISQKQFIEIVTALPPASASEQIKSILSKINTYVSFIGIIIKNATLSAAPEPAVQANRSSTHDSIANLNKTEESTENFLAPSGIISPKKWIGALFRPRKKDAGEVVGRKNGMFIKDEVFARKKTFNFFKIIAHILKNILVYFSYLLLYALKYFKRKDKAAGLLRATKNSAEKIRDKFFFSFRSLNKRNRILLSLSLIFFVLFIANIITASMRKEKIQLQNQYNDLVALITQKQNQAEANLLYSNNEGAEQLFGEIQGLLDKLPRNTDEQKKQLAAFQDKFNSQIEEIRHVERVDPALVSDFSILNSRANPDNIVLATEANKIYAADSGQKSVYILGLGDNQVTTVTELAQPITQLTMPVLNQNNLIDYYNGDSIARFSIDKEAIDVLPIDLPGDRTDCAAADTYSGRLYLLAPEEGQIYRYNQSASGFSSPYAWMRDKADLTQAVDMSIDGNIYVLAKNGKVMKFLRGQSVQFGLGIIDPPLDNAAEIFVSPELDFIYIMEPAGQRIAVFDKSGQFIKQYKSDKFTDLKDFVVDEQSKVIYCLNGAAVLSFPATNLES